MDALAAARLEARLHRRAQALEPAAAGPADADAPLVVLAAAKLGTTRLIDNLEI